VEKESNIVPNLSPRVDRSFWSTVIYSTNYTICRRYRRRMRLAVVTLSYVYNLLLHSYLLIHVFLFELLHY